MIKRVLNEGQREILKKIKESFINNLTETQIENYIDNNITDLTSAKAFLKKLSKVILYILEKTNLQ